MRRGDRLAGIVGPVRPTLAQQRLERDRVDGAIELGSVCRDR
jgi:hypothetical protein